MKVKKLACVALVATSLTAAGAALAQDSDGVIKVKSAYSMDETIARIKDDIAKKGIMFFSAVDQQSLAAKAGIELGFRTREQVARFFDGLELVPPGLVTATEWGTPGNMPESEPSGIYAGVARIP